MTTTFRDQTAPSVVRRRALTRAMWLAVGSVLVTGGLVAMVDAGARILGPILIVFGALAGQAAVRAWWANLAEQWFAAELVLVTAGWALFAASFAAIQYLVFSFIPGALHVDPDLGRLIEAPHQAEWTRDSTQEAMALGNHQAVLSVLGSELPNRLVADTTYRAGALATITLSEQCDDPIAAERCPWKLVLARPNVQPIQLIIRAPERGVGGLARVDVARRIEEEARRREAALAKFSHDVGGSARPIRPRIADFLYDTAIAFSGRESGVFVPLGALARTFKVIESLASYILFGVVASRVAAAAATELKR